jgi:hypothetical protein
MKKFVLYEVGEKSGQGTRLTKIASLEIDGNSPVTANHSGCFLSDMFAAVTAGRSIAITQEDEKESLNMMVTIRNYHDYMEFLRETLSSLKAEILFSV